MNRDYAYSALYPLAISRCPSQSTNIKQTYFIHVNIGTLGIWIILYNEQRSLLRNTRDLPLWCAAMLACGLYVEQVTATGRGPRSRGFRPRCWVGEAHWEMTFRCRKIRISSSQKSGSCKSLNKDLIFLLNAILRGGCGEDEPVV